MSNSGERTESLDEVRKTIKHHLTLISNPQQFSLRLGVIFENTDHYDCLEAFFRCLRKVSGEKGFDPDKEITYATFSNEELVLATELILDFLDRNFEVSFETEDQEVCGECIKIRQEKIGIFSVKKY